MAAEPPPIVAVPSTVDPSMNCTVPVAEPGVTVAESRMFCPKGAGFCEEISVTLVATLLTV